MKFSKRDVVFLGTLLFICLTSLLAVSIFQKKEGARVRITVDNQTYGIYSLGENQEIPIEIQGEAGNTLKIENQKASMIQATCPDKLCVHQKSISRQGETIVCLPHKVVVEILSEERSDFDSLAQ